MTNRVPVNQVNILVVGFNSSTLIHGEDINLAILLPDLPQSQIPHMRLDCYCHCYALGHHLRRCMYCPHFLRQLKLSILAHVYYIARDYTSRSHLPIFQVARWSLEVQFRGSWTWASWFEYCARLPGLTVPSTYDI